MPERPDPSELEGVAALVRRAAEPFDAPADLADRTFARIAAVGGAAPAAAVTSAPRIRRLPRRARAGIAGALAVAAAVVLALVLIGGEDRPPVELRAQLTGAGGATASAVVRNTGAGRLVEFETDDLPILPTGELYELWFVAPGDRPGSPRRISGGTFHPDADGRSVVELHAAVDPALYPIVAVSAEPGDGDPRQQGPDVLRSRP